MRKAKHTAGPWTATQRYGNLHLEISANDAGKAVAYAWAFKSAAVKPKGRDDYAPDAEGQANARLIAAAPELLAALEQAAAIMAEVFQSHPVYSDVDAVPRALALSGARAAIAKATASEPQTVS